MTVDRHLILTILCFLFVGCDDAPEASQIHLVGEYGSWNTAFYWNDGNLNVLDEPDGEFHVVASSVVVSEGTTYVGGSFDGRPCYWEDGARQELDCESGTIQGVATDSEGRLVLAGSCDELGALWIDGVRRDLEIPSGRVAVVNAMTFASGVVYVAGFHRDEAWEDPTIPCYWRDGDLHELPIPDGMMEGGSVQIHGIAVSGGTPYIAGTIDSIDPDQGAGYFAGDAWNSLNGSSARAIAVRGDTVYVAGRDQDGACYWENGSKVRLRCPSSTIATAIAVHDGAPVIGGKCGSLTGPEQVGYWVDGEWNQIHEASIIDINALFVS